MLHFSLNSLTSTQCWQLAYIVSIVVFYLTFRFFNKKLDNRYRRRDAVCCFILSLLGPIAFCIIILVLIIERHGIFKINTGSWDEFWDKESKWL